jgi:hypothetical protein
MNCRNYVLMCSTALVLCLSFTAFATTRYVSANGAGQYSLPSQAEAAAVSGDTILIGPGTYIENVVINNKRLTFVGAGWDQTDINGGIYINGQGSIGTIIEGLRVDPSTGNSVNLSSSNSITFRRCILKSSARVINQDGGYGGSFCVEDCILIAGQGNYTISALSSNGGMVFRNSLFANTNSPYGAINGSATTGVIEVYNCIFLNYRIIFEMYSGALPFIAVNNVFYDWAASPTFGSIPAGSTFDYNASETITAPGTNTLNITANPFVNYNSTNDYQHGISDLHLAGGSALIDAGHPSLLDLDNSRSDYGIYGGPMPLVDNGVPNYPWAVNIVLSPNLVGQGTNVNASATGRVGPQY